MKLNASSRWPLIIVGLLTAHVTLMMWAVAKCKSAGDLGVIPNYYEKAVRYDEYKAEQARLAAAAAAAATQSLSPATQPTAVVE